MSTLSTKPASLPWVRIVVKLETNMMTKIYKLQRKIAIAYLNKNKRLWSKLQNELVNLEEVKMKAIMQVHRRKSSETSGVDGIVLRGSKGKSS